MSLKSGSEVLPKDFKFGIVYNYSSTLDPLYNFIVLRIDGDTIFISDENFTEIHGVEFRTELDPYFFVRELTELTKALL
jgi:hypothetical protein